MPEADIPPFIRSTRGRHEKRQHGERQEPAGILVSSLDLLFHAAPPPFADGVLVVGQIGHGRHEAFKLFASSDGRSEVIALVAASDAVRRESEEEWR